MQHSPEKPGGFSLASIGLRLSDWFERWFPDAFALALAACAIVFAASLAIGAPAAETAQWFGAGFWDLVAFTMQITIPVTPKRPVLKGVGSMPAQASVTARKVTTHAAAIVHPILRVVMSMLPVLHDLPRVGQSLHHPRAGTHTRWHTTAGLRCSSQCEHTSQSLPPGRL